MTETVAVALLGLSCGFASTVWVIVGTTSIRSKHWWLAASYGSLALANIVSTAVIGSNLIGRPYTLPEGSATLILLLLILIPPIIQLRAWLTTRPLIHHS